MDISYFNRRALRMTAATLVVLSTVSLSFLAAGCGGGNSGGKSPVAGSTRKVGTVQMTVKWPRKDGTRKIPLAANSLTVTVTGASSVVTKTVARPTDGSTSTTISFDSLPIGSYTLAGAAYASTDGTGTALAKAATTVVFTVEDPSKTATLDLATTIKTLVVTPNPVSLSMEGTTTTATLAVSGYDDSGNMIPVGNLSYSIENSAVAVVDATTGIVTAKGLGTTTITVTDSDSGLTTTVPVEVGKIATPLWSKTLDGPVRSSATIAPNGNIFIGGNAGTLYGFAPSGDALPGFPVDLSATPGDQISKPVVDSSGRVYVTSSFGTVYVVDGSGNIVLAQAVSGAYSVASGVSDSRVSVTVALDASGTIYVPTITGQIVVIKTPTTTPAISAITVGDSDAVVSTPVIDSATGNIYISTSTLLGQSALFRGFQPDGTSLFDPITLDGSVATGVALGTNGKAYVATGLTTSGGVKVYAINLGATPTIESGWPVTLPNTVLVSGSVTLGADNTVYLGTWGGISTDTGSVGGQVFALNPSSGATVSGWPYRLPFVSGYLYSDVDSSVTVGSDGTIYAGSTNNKIYAIHPNGTKVWEAALVSEIRSTPTVSADGTVYIGADSGAFTALK